MNNLAINPLTQLLQLLNAHVNAKPGTSKVRVSSLSIHSYTNGDLSIGLDGTPLDLNDLAGSMQAEVDKVRSWAFEEQSALKERRVKLLDELDQVNKEILG